MGKLRALLGVAALTGGLLMLAGWGARYCVRQVNEQWLEQLDRTADADLAPLLKGTLDQGPWGLARVVRGLGSARTAVAETAMDALADTLDQWQSLPPDAAVSHLVELTECLAQEIDVLPPQGRLKASDLAIRVLRWPRELPQAARVAILAHCDVVLHTAKVASPPAPESPLRADALPPPAAIVGIPLPTPATPSSLPGGNLPGGGLPVDVSGLPPLPLAVANQPSEAPHLLRASSTSDLLPADEPGRFYTTEPTHSLASRRPAMEAEAAGRLGQRSRPGDIRQMSLAETRAMYARNENRPADNPSGEISTLELIRRMRASDPTSAALARDELTRRGFGPQQFQIADRMADPNPRRRKELAEELPGLSGVDPASWLLWLAEDEDADVRLTAVSCLASTDAPDVLRQVERIATQDPDPRVQSQVEHIAQRRRAQLERSGMR